MHRSEEVAYLQLDNRLSIDKLQLALDTAVTSCQVIRELLENAIKGVMSDTKQLLRM